MFLAFATCIVFIATLMPIWPRILGTVLYTNESQLQINAIQITTEYFIDKKKYFYFILLHANVVICIGSTTVTAIGTIILSWLIHICGIFRIAR